MNVPSDVEMRLLRLIAGGTHLPMMLSAALKCDHAMTASTVALRQMERHGWIRGVKSRGWFLTDAGRALLPAPTAAPELPTWVPPKPLPVRPGGEDYKRCPSVVAGVAS